MKSDDQFCMKVILFVQVRTKGFLSFNFVILYKFPPQNRFLIIEMIYLNSIRLKYFFFQQSSALTSTNLTSTTQTTMTWTMTSSKTMVAVPGIWRPLDKIIRKIRFGRRRRGQCSAGRRWDQDQQDRDRFQDWMR